MRIVLILILIIVSVTLVVYGLRTDNIDRRTVRDFDIARYMGEWYEIARFDHSFERNLTDVTATYKLMPKGCVDVLNSGRDLKTGQRKEAHGKAYACKTPGRLRVSFFWIFYSDYNVLELDEAYQWALVGSRSSKYLWILSRTPQLPETTLQRILHKAQRRGYKTEKLLFIGQSAQPAAQ